jgi:hypothetical protein
LCTILYQIMYAFQSLISLYNWLDLDVQIYLLRVYLSRFPNVKCENNAKSTEKSSLQFRLYYHSVVELVLSSFWQFLCSSTCISLL